MMPIYIPTPETTRRASDPAGQIHHPGDVDWDQARMAWNLAVDQRPAAVALPRSAEEVASVIRAAAQSGLRVSAQGTGHAAAAYDSLADTILIRTTRMRGVQVDPAAGRARVAAGTLWLDAVARCGRARPGHAGRVLARRRRGRLLRSAGESAG